MLLNIFFHERCRTVSRWTIKVQKSSFILIISTEDDIQEAEHQNPQRVAVLNASCVKDVHDEEPARCGRVFPSRRLDSLNIGSVYCRLSSARCHQIMSSPAYL